MVHKLLKHSALTRDGNMFLTWATGTKLQQEWQDRSRSNDHKKDHVTHGILWLVEAEKRGDKGLLPYWELLGM